jgi:sulfur relay protein TusB/DsrH
MDRVPENRSCLHLVTRSSSDALNRCSAFCTEQDDILFIGDAVMFLVSEPDESWKKEPAGPLFLKADLEARGLAEIASELGVRTVTDLDFAALLRKHDSCLTWK